MDATTQQKINQNPDNQVQLSQATNQIYFTVKQFAKMEPAFTEASLRALIFKATNRNASLGPIEGNGLIEAGALVRLGRKILIHRSRFMSWLQKTDSGSKSCQ